MVDIYADLIIQHRKTLDDVPLSIRNDVYSELLERGYDEHGDPIVPDEEVSDESTDDISEP